MSNPTPSSTDEHNAVTVSSIPFRTSVTLLWSFAHPHLGTIVLGVLLGLVATAMMLASPLATKWVLDSLEKSLDIAGPVTPRRVVGLGTVAGLAQTVLLGRLAETLCSTRAVR